MDRREFIGAAGTVAAVTSTSQAFAQMAAEEPNMHPPKYKALEKATFECVATGNDCLRHCFGMYKMKDTSMAACADAAFQLVNACSALRHWQRLIKHSTITTRVIEWPAIAKDATSSPKLPCALPAATRVRSVPTNAVRLLLNQ
jgi:Cys-rich four helix bundle protein (predicted Tat secretion target)